MGDTKYVCLKRPKLPRTKVYRCGSKAAARQKYADLKALKLTKAKDHHGYKILPAGVRIRIRRPRA